MSEKLRKEDIIGRNLLIDLRDWIVDQMQADLNHATRDRRPRASVTTLKPVS